MYRGFLPARKAKSKQSPKPGLYMRTVMPDFGGFMIDSFVAIK
jgi:hypothetical protein